MEVPEAALSAAKEFDMALEDRPLTFGVSGMLWRASLLMFDRETESLWKAWLEWSIFS